MHQNSTQAIPTAMAAVGISTVTVTSMASRISIATQTLGGGNLASINNLQELIQCHLCGVVFCTVDAEFHLALAIVGFIHPPS